ncbi:MAG: isopentenyl-diphosphate delta-isomerase, partial [Nannocystaceae bacterium]|nr:isopentenyl-diphosphate delta-isomerase [Nannocystaceae bacterium]
LPDWTPGQRTLDPASLAPTRRDRRRGNVRARGLRDLAYGDDTICLDGLEQLVDPSQVRLLGTLLEWASEQPRGTPIAELAAAAVARAQDRGLYALRANPELAAVRPAEVAAAINRMRRLALTA